MHVLTARLDHAGRAVVELYVGMTDDEAWPLRRQGADIAPPRMIRALVDTREISVSSVYGGNQCQFSLRRTDSDYLLRKK